MCVRALSRNWFWHITITGRVKNNRPSRKSSVVVHQSVRRPGAVVVPFIYSHYLYNIEYNIIMRPRVYRKKRIFGFCNFHRTPSAPFRHGIRKDFPKSNIRIYHIHIFIILFYVGYTRSVVRHLQYIYIHTRMLEKIKFKRFLSPVPPPHQPALAERRFLFSRTTMTPPPPPPPSKKL